MQNFFYDHLLFIPAIAFVFSVFLKWIISSIKDGKFDLSVALWSWWMPSAHSAVAVSLATSIALKHGISSDLFAISMAFTVIILYDAINVRFEAWLHARAINKYIWEKKFRESLWHLPSEAFAGSIVGIIVAVVLYYF